MGTLKLILPRNTLPLAVRCWRLSRIENPGIIQTDLLNVTLVAANSGAMGDDNNKR